jgi:hypothetical protein
MACLFSYLSEDRCAALTPRLIAGRKIIVGVKVAGALADNHLLEFNIKFGKCQKCLVEEPP